jgi:hypothetical protein
VRLNEWPEWFTVDENTLYRLTDASGQEQVRLGSELKTGIDVTGSGRWVVEPFVSSGNPGGSGGTLPSPSRSTPVRRR